jgi:hypothetical protein
MLYKVNPRSRLGAHLRHLQEAEVRRRPMRAPGILLRATTRGVTHTPMQQHSTKQPQTTETEARWA